MSQEYAECSMVAIGVLVSGLALIGVGLALGLARGGRR